MRQHLVRRGTTSVQWIVIAALIVLAIVGTVATVGTRTSPRRVMHSRQTLRTPRTPNRNPRQAVRAGFARRS